MVTDEMVEAFGQRFWPVNAASKIDANREDLRAALEAALSTDAEPVAYRQPVDAKDFREAIQLLPSVMRPELSRAIIAALNSPSPPAPSVAVKDLQWERMYDEETYHAQSIVGRWARWDGHYLPPNGYGGIACTDAIAAAQADYEARIRSALSTQEQDVATAREFADRMFKLSGFMLSEMYQGKHAVTIKFPDLAEAQQFHGALVELSTHKTPQTKQEEAE